jgi:acetoin utilization protein AcuB
MPMPTISRYMTRQPFTIGPDAKLSEARALMRDHGIRHLPVLDAGKLIGIVSERDVFLFDQLMQLDKETTVEDAMSVDVYAAWDDDPIDVIVERMVAHKYGSAVVLDRAGGVEGIFTTVDALQVLAEVLPRAAA